MKTVVLVGPPGVGKTTILQRLKGQQLNGQPITAADLDEEITQRTGKTPGELIGSEGEKKFREEESRALFEVLKKNLDLLAVGGGTYCEAKNQVIINELGFSVFLDESEEELAKRILSDELKNRSEGLGVKRPVLYKTENRTEPPSLPDLETTKLYVQRLLRERLPHYEKAHLTLNCVGKTESEIVSEILKLVARRNAECL